MTELSLLTQDSPKIDLELTASKISVKVLNLLPTLIMEAIESGSRMQSDPTRTSIFLITGVPMELTFLRIKLKLAFIRKRRYLSKKKSSTFEKKYISFKHHKINYMIYMSMSRLNENTCIFAVSQLFKYIIKSIF